MALFVVLFAFVAALLAGVSSWAGCSVCWAGAVSGASVARAAGEASAASSAISGTSDTRGSCSSCPPSSVAGALASWVAPLRISSNDERALRWAGASSEVWVGGEAARSAPVRAASAVTSASS